MTRRRLVVAILGGACVFALLSGGAGAVQPGTNGKIAIASSQNGATDIWTVDSSGGNPAPLTNGQGISTAPSWSPDGKRIAFESTRDNPSVSTSAAYELYVMNANGSNPVRLTTNAATDFQPVFSPDGKRLVFYSDRDGDFEIYVMNVDGSNVVQLTKNADSDNQPVWSPNGTRIAFNRVIAGAAQLYVMNANGTGQTAIPGTQGGANPSWSPDGSTLAFVRFYPTGGSDVFVVHPDGTGLQQLTKDAGVEFQPVWSPDGTKLALALAAPGTTAFRLETMNANGSGLAPIGPGAGTETFPAWQTLGFPSGCTIIGTLGNDTLVGTPRADTICSLAGDDRLSGLGGNDVLLGGDGNDLLSGGPGRDRIDGGAGTDTADGGSGKDTCLAEKKKSC